MLHDDSCYVDMLDFSPSGRIFHTFKTVIRLLMSLSILDATPGYCNEMSLYSTELRSTEILKEFIVQPNEAVSVC